MAYPAPTELIKPITYGGFGKADGLPYGGLEDLSFSARCPPVVTPDTIIIAVCGPNDFEGNAAPDKDGWFFSDFYLFHHLMRSTSKQQYWLTCVRPHDLVKKYKEYAHGNPKSDQRRIVLDQSMMVELGDILVFQPNDLLERFLSYLANMTKQTKNTLQPILVLMFGHGVEDVYSVLIGGRGAHETCPTVTRSKFKEALLRYNPNPNVTLLTTSCYGGAWVETDFFNITGMAGVNRQEEVLSWSASASLQRCCGSRYATGVAQALIKMEIQELDLLTDDGQEVLSSPTYAALVRKIHDTLTKEVDVREDNYISFSAKDDLWDSEWRMRSGFPLTDYKAKWESLQAVPNSDTTETTQVGSIRLSDTVSLNTPQAEYRLKRLANEYLLSYPGPDEAAKNHHVHNNSKRLLKGGQLSKYDLETLAGALRYRMNSIMARATEYKDRLGIAFKDCRNTDVSGYFTTIAKDGPKHERWNDIYHMAVPRRLFEIPLAHEGLPYDKGNKYLVMVLTESDWSREKVEAALNELVKLKGKQILLLSIILVFMDYAKAVLTLGQVN